MKMEESTLTPEECEKLISKDKCLQEYLNGYQKGQEECAKKFKEEKCVDQFVDGYKNGFADGYQAAMEDIKDMQTGQDSAGVKPKPWWAWW